MTLDRAAFFAAVRARFGALTQAQVDGFTFLLDAWEARYRERTPSTQFANVLATTAWETGRTMQPIREKGDASYFTRLYDVQGRNPTRARRMGNVRPGDGARYNGRGYVQLTWFVNYQKATKRLRDLGVIGPDVDFTRAPDLVMRPEYAVVILFEGMEQGWFTGVDLDDCIDGTMDGDEHADFVRARRIINGTDKAEQIASLSDAFLVAIQAGLKAGTSPAKARTSAPKAVTSPPSVPVTVPTPPVAGPVAPKPGFLARLFRRSAA